MTNNVFIDNLKNLDSYKELIDSIESKLSPISVRGLSGESISHIAYGMNKHLKRQVLILTYDDLRARTISEDLSFFNNENSELFPSRDIVFYDIDAFSHDIQNQRLKVLERLSKGEDLVVVASIKSIMNKVMSYEEMKTHTSKLEFGEVVDFDTLSEDFSEKGYERVDMIEGRGQFAVRGGILDFFPINSDHPIRVEFFDDEIDSIRMFDLTTQRSIENIKEIDIPPVREIVIEDNEREGIIARMENDLKLSLENLDKNEEFEDVSRKISEKFNDFINKIKNKLNITNLDLILPFLEM